MDTWPIAPSLCCQVFKFAIHRAIIEVSPVQLFMHPSYKKNVTRSKSRLRRDIAIPTVNNATMIRAGAPAVLAETLRTSSSARRPAETALHEPAMKDRARSPQGASTSAGERLL
jgi:hypothetical protein